MPTDPTDVGFVNSVVDEIMDAQAQATARHSVRKLSPDEIAFAVALDAYDTLKEADGTLKKVEASRILGILNKCSDDGLWQCANQRDVPGLRMDNSRDVFRRMAAILLKRRGVQAVGRIIQ